MAANPKNATSSPDAKPRNKPETWFATLAPADHHQKSGLQGDLHHLSTDPGVTRFTEKSAAETQAKDQAHEESGQHPQNSLGEDIRKILDGK